jgi:hypothetical protein
MKALSIVPVCLMSLSLLAVCGCGSGGGNKTYKVTGKVTFSDGSPLTEGIVVFSGDAMEAKGGINADGTYSLTSYKPGDGAPAGFYKVYLGGNIYKPAATPAPPVDPTIEQYLESTTTSGSSVYIDEKFRDVSTSGLTCEVKGKTTFNITVERAP